MKIIDSHCHIDWFKNIDLPKIIEDVSEIYAVSISYESSLKVLDIASKYSTVKVALGIHPEYFEYYEEFEQIRKLIIKNRDKLYAIGEVGLPYFSILEKNIEEKEQLYNKGLELLEKFILLAKELNLPLVLHATQSTSKDALKLLKKYNIKNVLFHWLHCDIKTAKEIFNSNFFASVSVDIIHNREYLEFIATIPLKNLLIESDSPWKYDDNSSKPKDVYKVLEKLSVIHGISINELNDICNRNMELFLKMNLITESEIIVVQNLNL